MKMMIKSNRNGDCVVFMVVGLWLVVIGVLSLTIDSEERRGKEGEGKEGSRRSIQRKERGRSVETSSCRVLCIGCLVG